LTSLSFWSTLLYVWVVQLEYFPHNEISPWWDTDPWHLLLLCYHYQVNYGNFMHGLLKENFQLNRKVLSEKSMHEPYSFKALVDISRNAFPGKKNVVHRPRKVDISSVNV